MEALTITSSAVGAAQLHSPEWKSAVGFQSVLGTESPWNSHINNIKYSHSQHSKSYASETKK